MFVNSEQLTRRKAIAAFAVLMRLVPKQERVAMLDDALALEGGLEYACTLLSQMKDALKSSKHFAASPHVARWVGEVERFLA